jgi:tetratricopeptide (TPR) repeat protein
VRGWRAAHAGNSEEHLVHNTRAIELFEQTGDVRSLCRERTNLGFAYCELGLYEEAERPLRGAMETADRMGLGSVSAVAKQNLAMALARQGRVAEARALVEDALGVFRAQGDRRMEMAAAITLAQVLKVMNDLEAAEHTARAAAHVAAAPPDRCQALGALADVLLSRRKFAEALAAAKESTELLESLGGIDEGEALVRLVYAKSLAANGLLDEAKAAAGAARERLRARAATMRDPQRKKTFLEKVPDNARTMELAHAWLGD